jgi:hypothetical protein
MHLSRHHQTSVYSGSLCGQVMASVRSMTGKARTTSICWKAVDCPLGKAEGPLAGFPARVEHESGQDEGYGKAL